MQVAQYNRKPGSAVSGTDSQSRAFRAAGSPPDRKSSASPRNPMWIPLTVHSHFSLMRGVCPPEDLCRRASELGYPALALTDINGFYGLIWYLQAAQEAKIRGLVGVDLWHGGRRVTALARNRRDYEALSGLVTALHCKPGFDLLPALSGLPDGLPLLAPPGDLLCSLRGRKGLYGKLSPGPGSVSALMQIRKAGVPPAATPSIFYVHPDQHQLHRLLRAIDLNASLSSLQDQEVEPEGSALLSTEELAAALPHCPEALDATLEIAEMCGGEMGFGTTIFPQLEGEGGEEKSFELLRKRCIERIPWRYGPQPGPAVLKRLEHELATIRDKGFAAYFLVLQDISQQAGLTCGRGSAAASIVSYLLGITHVDPIRHNLFFERFLNPGRVDPPDIDIDFAWDERDGVLGYVFEKYGRDKAAMVGNHVGFNARGSIREIAKVYGLPECEIKRVTSRMSGWWRAEAVEDGISAHPMFRDMDLPVPWPEIIRAATLMEGHPRYLSVHCGGVVVVPRGVSSVVPTQFTPKGVPVIQWEKDQTEDSGLVKMDLLGNRSLAVIRDALAAIKLNYGVTIPYENFNPLDDLHTRELIANGDTVGVFYVESPAMRQLQKKTRRGDYEHLVIHSSIIRPAANEFIREYVRRLRGGSWRPIHPALEDLLAETYGIMVYQEDVTKAAMALAGFDASKADGLRKILSKKHGAKKLEWYRNEFFSGARERNVDKATLEAVWRMIESFSGYSFCKPHSASFALVSFKSCYIRAHYPAEFIAAVLSNQGGYYAPFAYISEARRMGLRVLGPDINRSERHYTGIHDRVRIGLMQIGNLTGDGLDEVICERSRNGPYASFEDFLRRTGLKPEDVRSLIKAGCFDDLEGQTSRPALHFALARHMERRRVQKGQTFSLFEDALPEAPAPRPPAYNAATILRHEVEALGFLSSRHPLSLYGRALSRYKPVKASELHRHVGRKVWVAGWYVTGKPVQTKQGEPMEFVSFEDTTALYETIFFPDAYRMLCRRLTDASPYVLYGLVEEEYSAVSVNVKRVEFADSGASAADHSLKTSSHYFQVDCRQ